jgi:hypothetical protein
MGTAWASIMPQIYSKGHSRRFDISAVRPLSGPSHVSAAADPAAVRIQADAKLDSKNR